MTFRLRKDFQDLRARIIKLAFLTKISDSKIPNSALSLIVTHCNIPKWQLWHKLLGQKFASKINLFKNVPCWLRKRTISKRYHYDLVRPWKKSFRQNISMTKNRNHQKSVKMTELGKKETKPQLGHRISAVIILLFTRWSKMTNKGQFWPN